MKKGEDFTYKSCKKIAQLTKVIAYLNTQAEDYAFHVQDLTECYEEEINFVILDARTKLQRLEEISASKEQSFLIEKQSFITEKESFITERHSFKIERDSFASKLEDQKESFDLQQKTLRKEFEAKVFQQQEESSLERQREVDQLQEVMQKRLKEKQQEFEDSTNKWKAREEDLLAKAFADLDAERDHHKGVLLDKEKTLQSDFEAKLAELENQLKLQWTKSADERALTDSLKVNADLTAVQHRLKIATEEWHLESQNYKKQISKLQSEAASHLEELKKQSSEAEQSLQQNNVKSEQELSKTKAELTELLARYKSKTDDLNQKEIQHQKETTQTKSKLRELEEANQLQKVHIQAIEQNFASFKQQSETRLAKEQEAHEQEIDSLRHQSLAEQPKQKEVIQLQEEIEKAKRELDLTAKKASRDMQRFKEEEAKAQGQFTEKLGSLEARNLQLSEHLHKTIVELQTNKALLQEHLKQPDTSQQLKQAEERLLQVQNLLENAEKRNKNESLKGSQELTKAKEQWNDNRTLLQARIDELLSQQANQQKQYETSLSESQKQSEEQQRLSTQALRLEEEKFRSLDTKYRKLSEAQLVDQKNLELRVEKGVEAIKQLLHQKFEEETQLVAIQFSQKELQLQQEHNIALEKLRQQNKSEMNTFRQGLEAQSNQLRSENTFLRNESHRTNLLQQSFKDQIKSLSQQ